VVLAAAVAAAAVLVVVLAMACTGTLAINVSAMEFRCSGTAATGACFARTRAGEVGGCVHSAEVIECVVAVTVEDGDASGLDEAVGDAICDALPPPIGESSGEGEVENCRGSGTGEGRHVVALRVSVSEAGGNISGRNDGAETLLSFCRSNDRGEVTGVTSE
jgi:hypothetical protein